jgi:hypothetical protein
MNVEIGTEAALFPEKEYINGFAVAVHAECSLLLQYSRSVRSIPPQISA